MKQLIIILSFLHIICFGQIQGLIGISSIKSINGIGYVEAIDTITFTSTQGAGLNQVSAIFQVYDSSDSLYIDWGEDDPVAIYNTSDQVVTSAYSVGSTTYTIKLYGHLSNLKKFYIYNETTVSLNSDQLAKAENIQEITVQLFNTNFICNSINFVDLDSLKILQVRTPDPSSIFNSIHLVGKDMIILNIYYWSSNCIFNSVDIESMIHMQYLALNIDIHEGIVTSYHSRNMLDLYLWWLTSDEPQDTVKSWHLAYGSKNLWYFQRFGKGYNDSINSLDFVAMDTLERFLLGHVGTGAWYNSSHFTQNLTNVTLYPDGGQFIIDLSDYSSMPLTTFYCNASTDTAYITAGKLADLPATCNTIYTNNVGNLDITTGTFPAWNACNISLLNSHPTGEVDGFLNAYDAVAGSGTKIIDLRGNNQARSAASNAAVTSLQGKGRTIYTNP